MKEDKVFTAPDSSKGKLVALLIIAGVGVLSIFAGEEAGPTLATLANTETITLFYFDNQRNL